MAYSPSPVAGVVSLYAVELAARVMTAGRVVVYAGAGISISPPTSLPSGANLSRAIHSQFDGSFNFSDGLDSGDLVAMADEVAATADGVAALRQVAVIAADFKTARPGYTHRVLAYLMLEGVIDVLTTNWDTCIERGAGEEQLGAVVTDGDLRMVTPPSVLKIHGCATRPDSLLVTSAHLSAPPQWVAEQTHARLGSAVVVFLGIGDVAGYVKQRIQEAVRQVGAIDNIRVVSPSINTGWEESQWSTVAPALSEDRRIGKTSDEFVDSFAAAYVQACFKHHGLPLMSGGALRDAYIKAKDALCASDPLNVLSWARKADIKHKAGKSVLRSTEMGSVLVALGILVDDEACLDHRSSLIRTVDGPIEVLISSETVLTRQLVDEAEERLAEHLAAGAEPPRFLISRGIGPVLRSTLLPQDILAETKATDILDGPRSGLPEILLADEVIAS